MQPHTVHTAPPALAPGMALLFAGFLPVEIEAIAREGIAYMLDLAQAAALDLGAVLTVHMGARDAAIRDGADLPRTLDIREATTRVARDNADPIPGDALDPLKASHLLPSERVAWREIWAVRASRAFLARALARWGLRLAPLARSHRRVAVNGPLAKMKVRAPLGPGYKDAQGQGWISGGGSTRRMKADAHKALVASYALGEEIRDPQDDPKKAPACQRGLTRAEQDRIIGAVLRAVA